MKIINQRDEEAEKYFKSFKFQAIPSFLWYKQENGVCKLNYMNNLRDTEHVVLRTNYPISNRFNHFYFEVEVKGLAWINIGFASPNFPSNRQLGRTDKDEKSIGLHLDEKHLRLYHKGIRNMWEVIDLQKTIGFGMNILTGKLFVTVDGKQCAERNLPLVAGLYPTIILKPSCDVIVKFTDFDFELNEYLNKKNKLDLKLNQIQLKEGNMMFLIQDYLVENGFGKTLKKIDPRYTTPDLKRGKRSLKKKKTIGNSLFTDSEKESIRTQVISHDNFDFLFNFCERYSNNKQLKANIIVTSFVVRYFDADKKGEDTLKVLKEYHKDFIEYKDEEVYSSKGNIDDLVNCFLLDENLERYEYLNSVKHRNHILSLLFNSDKNNKLTKVLKHLLWLFKRNTDFYGFESGIDLQKLSK